MHTQRSNCSKTQANAAVIIIKIPGEGLRGYCNSGCCASKLPRKQGELRIRQLVNREAENRPGWHGKPEWLGCEIAPIASKNRG